MKVGKPKSKRVTVRLRHKIEKASAAKQRKDRKEAKKNPQWRSRLKKDPGIPNLFPYKDKLLAEIEESKRKKAEEQQRKRDLARAQREGKNVDVAEPRAQVEDHGDDEVLGDAHVDNSGGEDMEEDTNPLAALVASAQARAQTYQQHGDNVDDVDGDGEEESDGEFSGFADDKQPKNQSSSTAPLKKALPKQALADPIKAMTALIDRLEKTTEGMQQLLEYYQLTPLVTAGSDTTTRFLVDVARKRGRLGRGGIPNLNAAALTVLGDLHEERLRLPALQFLQSPPGAVSKKGEVRIVSELAQPFRIEGLFGGPLTSAGHGGEMDTAAS